MKTKQELLDQLEQETMIIAGEVRMKKMGAPFTFDLIEDRLGEIIKAILQLKKIEGIPSKLSIVEIVEQDSTEHSME